MENSPIDIFQQQRERIIKHQAPLADRMRPRTLEEYFGQDHIIGPGRLLRRAIQIDQLSSLIFYGPPGTGKTTLARIIAQTTKAQFLSINAVLAGIKDIREAIETARHSLELYAKKTILFIDEVHRFNKAQQDALLPHVENGLLILIGATTENPYFEVNKALVSRSRIFQLNKLTQDDLIKIARAALADEQRGYGKLPVDIDEEALAHLIQVSSGDARGVLNALELAVETTEPQNGTIRIDRKTAEDSIQKRAVLYDKDGDAHYDTISAFIKSIRGSDPDAALYWMAKMVYAGEDPRFIFRRLAILAAEDIGMADPQAVGVVMNDSRAFDFVGMPEGRFHLSHACLYCATAPKSNTTLAFFDALDVVNKEMRDEVPRHLRDSNRDKDSFGDGEGYLYPHAYRDHWVAQQYLPSALMGKLFYQPSDQGYENQIHELVKSRRETQLESVTSQKEDDIFSSTATTGSTKAQTFWTRRTAGNMAHVVSTIRNRLLALADIQRDELILDLHSRSGFLTFAALRTVASVNIWTITHTQKEYESLSKLAQEYNSLSRPEILQTNWSSFDEDVCRKVGTAVIFDKIIGRNCIFQQPDKVDIIKRIGTLLHKKGRCFLAESVPALGQRISDLCALDALGDMLKEAFIEAEKALFNTPANAKVNWLPDTLCEEVMQSTDIEIRYKTEEYQTSRRLTKDDIQHWFRTNKSPDTSSLGQTLAKEVSAEDMEKVKNFLINTLTVGELPWKTTTVYFEMKKKP